MERVGLVLFSEKGNKTDEWACVNADEFYLHALSVRKGRKGFYGRWIQPTVVRWGDYLKLRRFLLDFYLTVINDI